MVRIMVGIMVRMVEAVAVFATVQPHSVTPPVTPPMMTLPVMTSVGILVIQKAVPVPVPVPVPCKAW